MNPVTHFLERIPAHACSDLTDAELLRRFVGQHDEAAFAALVRRHGPMVWGVCRRVLGNDHDAEDVFQATFLLLVRRVPALRKPEQVGGWIHGVALRTALRARAQNARWHGPESLPEDLVIARPLPELAWRELELVLNEEIGRLSEKYRVPFVLCYLEGQTYACAARQLGWPTGTVSKRLARARELLRLRLRLSRRGFGIAAGLLGTLLSQQASSAAAPAALLDVTIKAAITVAAGGAETSVVSAKVAALTEGVMKAMFASKLKLVATILLLVGMLTSGAWLLIGEGLAIGGAGAAKDKRALPPILETGRTLTAAQGGKKEGGAPPSGEANATWQVGPTLEGHGGQVYDVKFSPDGKTLASASEDKSVVIWDVAKRETVRTLTHSGIVRAVTFAPDGKTLAAASGTRDEEPLVTIWDLETGKERRVLKHADIVRGLAFTRDGKILATASSPDALPGASKEGSIRFWDLGQGEERASFKAGPVASVALSPDGRKLAAAGQDLRAKLWEIDQEFAVKKETPLEEKARFVAFSPDGKHLAGAGEKGAHVWDVENGTLVKSFEHKATLWHLAFSPDGKMLAGALTTSKKQGDGAELAGAVAFWNLTSGEEMQRLRGKLAPVMSVAFAPPNGRMVALGLLSKEKVTVAKDGRFEAGPGVVVLCERK